MNISIYTPHNKLGSGGTGEVYMIGGMAHKLVHIGDVPDRKDKALELVEINRVQGEAVYINNFALPLSLDLRGQRRFHRLFTGALCMLEVDDSPYVNHLATDETANPLSFFIQNGAFYGKVALELVDGKNLEYLLGEGILLKDSAKALFDAGKGLQSVHEKGLVYGDFKPRNIMYAFLSQPGYGRGTLIDFDTARCDFSRYQPADRRLLMQLSRVSHPPIWVTGTLEYHSPEQIKGELVTSKSDVFSFGLTLFEALTGQYAMPRSATELRPRSLAMSIENRIRNFGPLQQSHIIQRLHRSLEAELPSTLLSLLEKQTSSCLAPNPQERSELGNLLEILEEIIDQASPEKLIQRPSNPVL